MRTNLVIQNDVSEAITGRKPKLQHLVEECSSLGPKLTHWPITRRSVHYVTAILLLSVVPQAAEAASYADSVSAYSPGTGYAIEFGTGVGYTNATAALGEPTRLIPGQFGGPVDPFNPPYLKEELVSVGAGGSLTLHFPSPIRNDSRNLFGLDFIVFGNSGFTITNGNFSGGGITDGTLFGANSGSSRVSVSSDNKTFFILDGSKASPVDVFYPTDGSGSFDIPVDPSLTVKDFSGKGLEGIRGLYAGSSGGAAFDLSWALDASGHSVDLSEVSYVRIEVTSGSTEIDGISVPGAVPEPGTVALFTIAGLLSTGWFGRRSVKQL